MQAAVAILLSPNPMTPTRRSDTRLAPDRLVRDLPDPPRDLWRIVGPGIVAAGVGLSSGEFILWPYIASQVGLVFLWGALLGVMTQFFLNMEIERYTLATGETACPASTGSGSTGVWCWRCWSTSPICGRAGS